MSQNLSSKTNEPGKFSRFKADVTTVDSEEWLISLTDAAKRATADTDKQLVADLRMGCEKAKSEQVTVLTKHYNRVIALAKGPQAEAGSDKGKDKQKDQKLNG